jgi:hypothetical protein
MSNDLIFNRSQSESLKNNIWVSEVKNSAKAKTASEYSVDFQTTLLGIDRNFADRFMFGIGFEVETEI